MAIKVLSLHVFSEEIKKEVKTCKFSKIYGAVRTHDLILGIKLSLIQQSSYQPHIYIYESFNHECILFHSFIISTLFIHLSFSLIHPFINSYLSNWFPCQFFHGCDSAAAQLSAVVIVTSWMGRAWFADSLYFSRCKSVRHSKINSCPHYELIV